MNESLPNSISSSAEIKNEWRRTSVSLYDVMACAGTTLLYPFIVPTL